LEFSWRRDTVHGPVPTRPDLESRGDLRHPYAVIDGAIVHENGSMADLIRVSRDTDFEEIAAFQRRAFGNEWLKSERRRLQRAEYYRWKYFPPAGPAWLATVRSQQELIAMVAAVPFRLAGGEGISTAWQLCDIATDPRFRNRGLFAGCLDALDTTLAGGMTFCFPNARSRAGLTKAGFEVGAVLSIHMMLVLPGSRASSSVPAAADALHGQAASSSAPKDDLHIERSREFFSWRYDAHPLNRYVRLAADRGAAHADVVVRRLFGDRIGVIADLSHTEQGVGAAKALARRWAASAGCLALVHAPGVASRPSSRRWQRPWHVPCYARGHRPVAGQGLPSRLHVQLGDWDAV
jgi:Acetyltransferase (GNAT) domain